MNKRNIQHGYYGWFEKGAIEKIETLPYKKQASCKIIYWSLCSMSAKKGNKTEFQCYKFDIARFGSVSERTVQRYLVELEQLQIIGMTPQDRKSNGKFERVSIWLTDNTSTAGQFEDSTGTARGQHGDSESDTINKVIKKEKKEIHTHKKSDNQYSSDFESFWSSYPCSAGRKGGKGDTYKRWKALTRDERLHVPRALEYFAGTDDWVKNDGEYIPGPAKWLHQRYYDNVPVDGGNPDRDLFLSDLKKKAKHYKIDVEQLWVAVLNDELSPDIVKDTNIEKMREDLQPLIDRAKKLFPNQKK